MKGLPLSEPGKQLSVLCLGAHSDDIEIGAGAAPALLHVDGAGTIDMVSLQSMKFSKLELPNAPTANPNDRRNARGSSITDMAFSDGRLWIAGLSSEEFSSKLRSVPYPFSSIDAGTTRSRTMPLTPATAASMLANVPRSVACVGGFGINRRMIFVMIASVPSEPTSRCVRS